MENEYNLPKSELNSEQKAVATTNIFIKFLKMINILFLIVGVVCLIQVFNKYSDIQNYNNNGQDAEATISNKMEYDIQTGIPKRAGIEKFRHLIVDFDIEGKLGSTKLKNSFNDFNNFKVGDTIKIKYLPKYLYENEALKQQGEARPYEFVTDREPVSTDYLKKSIFTSFQFVAGVVCLILFLFILKLKN